MHEKGLCGPTFKKRNFVQNDLESLAIDRRSLTGPSLGGTINSRSGYMHVMVLLFGVAKLPILELKTGPNNF